MPPVILLKRRAPVSNGGSPLHACLLKKRRPLPLDEHWNQCCPGVMPSSSSLGPASGSSPNRSPAAGRGRLARPPRFTRRHCSTGPGIPHGSGRRGEHRDSEPLSPGRRQPPRRWATAACCRAVFPRSCGADCESRNQHTVADGIPPAHAGLTTLRGPRRWIIPQAGMTRNAAAMMQPVVTRSGNVAVWAASGGLMWTSNSVSGVSCRSSESGLGNAVAAHAA